LPFYTVEAVNYKQVVNEPNIFYCACLSTFQQYTGGTWYMIRNSM